MTKDYRQKAQGVDIKAVQKIINRSLIFKNIQAKVKIGF